MHKREIKERIKKELTDEEFFVELDSMKSERTKKCIQKNAGKSADELFRNAMVMTMRSKDDAWLIE